MNQRMGKWLLNKGNYDLRSEKAMNFKWLRLPDRDRWQGDVSLTNHTHPQEQVASYFQSQSSYWEEIYASSGVQAEIYRARQANVLTWIDGLALAPGSRVLEVGCGAGFLSVALAQRGLHVNAIDIAETMVTAARERAKDELLSVEQADTAALPFANASFDLVLAIGVIPWLADPKAAIDEMARVCRPGGHVLLTADNRRRLIYLLDPLLNPMFAPLRKAVSEALARLRSDRSPQQRAIETLYTNRFIDMLLASTGLLKSRSRTLGFGPFTFLRHRFLPNALDIALHRHLQRLADRNMPPLRSMGTQYLVLASKPERA